MRYQIKYAAVCFTGLIRSHNEDNYNISGIYRQVDEPDREELLSGTAAVPGRRTFAVFDGMGGESCGEMASYIAAMHFDRLMKRRRSLWEVFHPEEYISRNLLEINGEICRYASEHKIRSMGTTAAVLFFDSKNVIWANLGDSRIYRFRRTGKDFPGRIRSNGSQRIMRIKGFLAERADLHSTWGCRRKKQESNHFCRVHRSTADTATCFAQTD